MQLRVELKVVKRNGLDSALEVVNGSGRGCELVGRCAANTKNVSRVDAFRGDRAWPSLRLSEVDCSKKLGPVSIGYN